MKYEGTKTPGEDQDYTAYLFSFRKKELEVLFAVLEKNLRYIPKTDMSMNQFRNRLGGLVKYFKKTINKIDYNKKNTEKD